MKRIFMAYPENIVLSVADPLTGIAGRQTFMPSPSELKAELDRLMAPIVACEDRQRRQRERRRQADEGMTAEEHARAAAAWERTRAEIVGEVRRTREDEIADAEAHLSTLIREAGKPVTIGDGLRARLAVMREESATAPRS